MTTYTNRILYRGYTLRQRDDNHQWEIYAGSPPGRGGRWGDLLHTSDTHEEAEAVVDDWQNAR